MVRLNLSAREELSLHILSEVLCIYYSIAGVFMAEGSSDISTVLEQSDCATAQADYGSTIAAAAAIGEIASAIVASMGHITPQLTSMVTTVKSYGNYSIYTVGVIYAFVMTLSAVFAVGFIQRRKILLTWNVSAGLLACAAFVILCSAALVPIVSANMYICCNVM